MKPVLLNLADDQEEANWIYINIDRVEVIDVMDGAGIKGIELAFPIDPEEAEEGLEPGDANLILNYGSVSEWQAYLASLPEMPYQQHPQGDWKNWCSSLADGSIPDDEMYW